MRSFGQVPETALAPPSAAPLAITPMPGAKEIPYDYVARFQLLGRRGERVQDVINVSVEGAFVAAAIGYSFVPARLPPPPSPPVIQLMRTFSSIDPAIVSVWQDLGGVANPTEEIYRCLAVRLCGIDFRYSIVDSASGRELQNQPVHNIAGLGEAAGNRPFRPFAKPMLFLPRSTIRIEVEEISEGSLYGDRVDRRNGAELFIVLHGYKILGYGAAQR
jgi:hypothetical protein